MGNNIKNMRQQLGISQWQLAKLSGLSVGYICHLELGTRSNPSMNTMEKVASTYFTKCLFLLVYE